MDRYEMMDERELPGMLEERRRKNELLEMMRVGVPGKRLPMPQLPPDRTMLEELRRFYENLNHKQAPFTPPIWGTRG